MTNKYFTPKLEDIRINYICEIPHVEKDNYIQHILTNDDVIRLMDKQVSLTDLGNWSIL
jgi:hypothetical protein